MTSSRPFVGRQRELVYLLECCQGQAAQLLLIHGRRRIGKTRLIREVLERLESMPSLYYLATLKDAQLQQLEFQRLAGERTGDALLARQAFSDWEGVLSYMAQTHPHLVIAFDEFPYLLAAEPAFATLLQKVWDEYAQGRGVKWILLGSQITVMERLLASTSPLYGRRTGSWHLKPLSFQDLCVYSELKDMDALQYYGFTGGVPFYWETLAFLDFEKDIVASVLSPGSLLYDEGNFLIREELREPREYFSILQGLGENPRKLGDLCQMIGVGKNIASKYLAVLRTLQLVERRTPITRRPETSQGIYAIADPFLKFWFRFVFPYKTALELGQYLPVLDRIRTQQGDHLAVIYEEVALARLATQALREGRTIQTMGRWWISRKGQQYEIDGVLFLDGETWCLEAKIGNRVNVPKFMQAVAALRQDTLTHGRDPGLIRLYRFEANSCFDGEEISVVSQM